MVALVPNSQVDSFTQIVKLRYFQEYLKAVHAEIVIEPKDFSEVILTCHATKGADRVFETSTDSKKNCTKQCAELSLAPRFSAGLERGLPFSPLSSQRRWGAAPPAGKWKKNKPSSTPR